MAIHRAVAHLECKVERLCGEVPDDICHVAAPERCNALLACHAHEAVYDALVPRDLARLDAWVAVLCLQDELHALDGRDDGLGDGTRDTASRQILQEAQGLVGHWWQILQRFMRALMDSLVCT